MTKLKQYFQLYLQKRFICNLVILSILYFVHCFWGDMMFIAFPILAIMVTLDNLENGISYIFFSLPFIFLKVYLSPILFLVCVIIFILKFYFVLYIKEKRKPDVFTLISLAFFFVYCLMPTGSYNLNTLLRLFIFIAIFIAFNMVLQKSDVFRGHYNIKIVCIAIIISSIFSLTYYFNPYLKDYIIMVYVDGNLARFMALFIHPNVLAMFCEVLLSLLLYYIASNKSTKTDFILFGIMSFIGLLTFSKTYLIIFAFLVIFLFGLQFKRNFKITSLVFASLAILFSLFFILLPNAGQRILDRFIGSIGSCKKFGDFMNMITTGRYDLWKEYLSYLGHNPVALFFGRGLGAPSLSSKLSPHNAYISMLYELGIVGTIFLVQALYCIFRNKFKKDQPAPHWAIIIPIIVIAMIFFVEDLIFYIFD